MTFADLAAIEIDDYLKNDRKSIEDLKIRLNKHLLPVFGHMKARRMRPAEINRYIAERKDAGTANATINRELSIIKRGVQAWHRFRTYSLRPQDQDAQRE